MKHHTDHARGAVLAVTSGKGGVGKTNVVINLAVSLARLGHRVGILDADFGLGNVDVMLGLTPVFHIGHVLTGERRLDEIVMNGPFGLQIIPASTGSRELTALTSSQWVHLKDIVGDVARGLDFLLIDTAAGISDNVIDLLPLAERVVVVTSFEPTAVVDAYAMVKIVTTAWPATSLGIVVNAGRDADESALVFRRLDIASSRFLNRGLLYYGFVVRDPAVRDAVLAHRPIVDHIPQSPASRCFRVMASRIAGFPSLGSGLLQADRNHDRGASADGGERGSPRCE
jgi:flagellar biosynthesis protein FlhG